MGKKELLPHCYMDITYWLWGGFSVDNATLRFFKNIMLLVLSLLLVQVLFILQLYINTGQIKEYHWSDFFLKDLLDG